MALSPTTGCLIRVSEGQADSAEFVLEDGSEAIIGSGEQADIRLRSKGVANAHAKVWFKFGQVAIEDMGSRQGFRINGGSSVRTARLHNGDQIKVGKSILRVVLRSVFTSEVPRPVDTGPAAGASPRPRPAPERSPPPELDKDDDEEEVTGVTRRVNIALEVSKPRLDLPARKPPPVELQHVWFELVRDDSWRSLAVVPTDHDTLTLPVVESFAQMAALNPYAQVLVVDLSNAAKSHGTTQVSSMASAVKDVPGYGYKLLDGSELGLTSAELSHIYVPQLLEYIAKGRGQFNGVLLALPNLLANATCTPIARAVDAVLLAVGKGKSRVPDVRRTVDILGKERVLGSIVVE